MLATIVVGASRPASAAPIPPASRYAAIVIESETGAVLYERNADLPRSPASLTKIMTLYLTFEALEAKRIALGDVVTVSAYAAGQDPSRLNLAPNSKITVEEAIRAMTTKSANDAACAMAERLGAGSETRFAEAMSNKARALGLIHTAFFNASGLPAEGHLSSARDLATLCKALVHDFPAYYHYFSMGAFEFHGTRYPNQNRFLRTYYGADGIKTGFVNASGHNLAASAVRGGKRLIAIVLGGESQAWTREHATRLLDTSYAKIDPTLVMVASNAPAPAAATPSASTPAAATTVETGSASAELEPEEHAPAATTYSTPAGAVTIASAKALPLPNATANLASYAATASAPAAPAGGAGSAPTPATAKPAGEKAAAATGTAVAAVPAPKPAALVAPAARPAQAAAPIQAAAKPSPAAPEPVRPQAPTVAAHSHPKPTEAPATVLPRTTTPGTEEPESEPKPPATTGEAPAAPAEAEVSGDWSVQVGLFRDATVARRRGEEARKLMPLQLRGADLVVGRAMDGVHVTSRISRLSEQDARAACSELQRGRVPCVVVPPGRPLVVATN